MMKRIIAIIMVLTLVMGNNVSVLASEAGDVGQVVSEEGATELEEGYELIIEDGVVTGYTGTPVDVVIPDGVVGIGSNAFNSCDTLKNVSIPMGVTYIGESAFSGCAELISIQIPESVHEIGSEAFYDCFNLEEVIIPDGVTIINDGMFSYCLNLKNVVIPNSVTTIGYSAFEDCRSLEEVIVPNGLKKILNYAFLGCVSLSRINLPDSVESIGSGAFAYCQFTEIEISKNVTSIGSSALQDCDNLKNIYVADGNANYCSVDGVLYNKSLTRLVTCPAGKESVVLPESVIDLGNIAFMGCHNLKEIEILGAITEIPEKAFYGCENLKLICIPEGVIRIGALAFSNCNALESVTFPNSLTYIGDYAFGNCSSLQDIIIPSGVTNIGDGVFSNCIVLKAVSIPDTVVEIGDLAFWDCLSLKQIILPSKLKRIGYWSFRECNDLSEIVFQGDVPELTGYTKPNTDIYSTPGGLKGGEIGDIFNRVEAIAYYPAGNETYTEEFMELCGGTVRFVQRSEDLDGVYTITFDAKGGKNLSEATRVVEKNQRIGTLPTVEKEGCTFTGWYTEDGTLVDEYRIITEDVVFYAKWLGDILDIILRDTEITIYKNAEQALYYTAIPSNAVIGDLVWSSSDEEVATVSSNGVVSAHKEGRAEITVTADNGVTASCIVTVESEIEEGYELIIEEGVVTGYVGAPVDVVIPEGVTLIEPYAFFGCTTVKSLVISEGVEKIGERAFFGCSNLESVSIPQSMMQIGGLAFKDTLWLEKKREENPLVIVNNLLIDGVTCNGNIEIPNGVKEVSQEAFWKAKSLTGVVIPESVKTIGYMAYEGCTNLANVVISEGVEIIDDSAFRNCALTEVNIPNGVKVIGGSAFRGCDELQKITIPESVKTFGENAFLSCDKLFIHGKTGSYAEVYANSNNIPFISIVEIEIYTLTFNANGGTNLSIATKEVEENQPVGTLPTVERAGYIFKGWYTSATGGTQITENTVITADTTFYAQWEKEIISIENATVKLSQDSFIYDGTEKKPTITVTLGEKTLLQGTDFNVNYSNCVAVGSATVMVAGIGSYTGSISATYTINKADISKADVILSATSFAYDATEKQPAVTVKLGDKTLALDIDYTVAYANNTVAGTAIVTITGKGNYTGTISKTYTITAASINDAIVTLSATSFNYDGKAKQPDVTVMLGNRTLSVADYTVTYKNNKNIGTAIVTITGKGNYTGTLTKTFTIKEKKGITFTSGSYKYKITSSSTVAFTGLKSTKTTKVTIPKTVKYGGKTFKVTSVADKALKGKTKVTEITIGANVTSIGTSAFAGCTKLSKVTIGKNVKAIGVSAFEGCKKLSKVSLGSAVTTIEDKAFKNCISLKSITIPSKVTKTDKQAFYGCKNLKTITIKSTKLKTVGKDALKGIHSKATIKVPKSKLSAYKKLLKGKGQRSKVKIVKY